MTKEKCSSWMPKPESDCWFDSERCGGRLGSQRAQTGKKVRDPLFSLNITERCALHFPSGGSWQLVLLPLLFSSQMMRCQAFVCATASYFPLAKMRPLDRPICPFSQGKLASQKRKSRDGWFSEYFLKGAGECWVFDCTRSSRSPAIIPWELKKHQLLIVQEAIKSRCLRETQTVLAW